MPSWLPGAFAGLLALLGSGGLFALLRFQRQEAGKMLEQHRVILLSMQTIVDEATEGFERMRAQRDHLERELRLCREESERSRDESHALRDELRRFRWEGRSADA